MASSATADTELLTEHFGYPPVSLLDDIINSVNILAERALNSVEQALLRQPPASLGFKPAAFQRGRGEAKLSPDALEAAAKDAHRHEVENGTHQLETLLCASIDRNFDKFELYTMRNILCVKPEDRDWMRLAHYEGLDFATAAEGGAGDGAADDASIAHLHRRLQASLKLGHLLHVEAQRNETMLARLRTLAGTGRGPAADQEQGADPSLSASSASSGASLAFLLDRGPLTESDAAQPLTTTTAFALSQLPALRKLSSELRQKAPGLAAAVALDDEEEKAGGGGGGGGGSSGRAGDSKSWRRERLEYIEGSTRKHLERIRGLNLGRNGEMRSEQGSSSQANDGGHGGNNMTVEPEALTNILNILRQNHGGREAEAATGDTTQPEDDTMDES
ncbi:kinetochore protein Mis12/MTW1 [Sporothrix brasiliensis 5110]|uniref:Kinetochore protein Mis12/MTW1 n=1 Tax=Sporothrix brasiliensis 5110 TaxID=1398154 RepID=A0A0C2IYQ3_9PEZI|nr:kinetochore protein Mis12/MTW1 [Sporothrix brasiliensis 5110]KIH91850.1 kinetochore protein Mis12/MTW1 [Sporothrix brasiliensis 5110]